jgi:hypothetical protein
MALTILEKLPQNRACKCAPLHQFAVSCKPKRGKNVDKGTLTTDDETDAAELTDAHQETRPSWRWERVVLSHLGRCESVLGYRFRINGREREMSLGPYPELSLGEARQKHADLRPRAEEDRPPL